MSGKRCCDVCTYGSRVVSQRINAMKEEYSQSASQRRGFGSRKSILTMLNAKGNQAMKQSRFTTTDLPYGADDKQFFDAYHDEAKSKYPELPYPRL